MRPRDGKAAGETRGGGPMNKESAPEYIAGSPLSTPALRRLRVDEAWWAFFTGQGRAEISAALDREREVRA